MNVKLLVVEDDSTARYIIQKMSGLLGFQVVITASCDEAISALRNCSFDAILMDYSMPRADGLECTRLIRDMERDVGRRTPIIAVTARAMSHEREQCFEGGMDDFLTKPYTMDELRKVVFKWTAKASTSPT